MDQGESWFDNDAGPLIRPFALTRGRAGSDHHQLNMITLVIAARPMADTKALTREYAHIVRICQHRPMSVAEIAANLDVLLTVTKVLISDLIDEGYLIFQSSQHSVNVPDMDLLQAVLDGVRRL
ncbi:MAG TPA: DUF742 domain-containing protein [Pseudonocardiaceae bacterium]|jgi:hypothetical protein|nr:DUF742 domain-containing protein [Pseudonocardiaceae bacterium]